MDPHLKDLLMFVPSTLKLLYMFSHIQSAKSLELAASILETFRLDHSASFRAILPSNATAGMTPSHHIATRAKPLQNFAKVSAHLNKITGDSQGGKELYFFTAS